MLSLDKKSLYAIEAMLTIASHQGEQPISGRDITSDHNLPPRYLEQILQKLVRADLLRGLRGPRGGYVLAREKRRITLADILEAVEAQSENFTSQHRAFNKKLNGIENQLLGELQQTTLQALATQPVKHLKTADFTI